jgi:hypothetical protein
MRVRGYLVARHATVVAWLALVAFSIAAIEVPLTYETGTDENAYFPHGYHSSEVTLTKPGGPWRLPEFVSGKPAYATMKLGDNEYLFVFDAGSESDKFYNRLYFDANANRDLTDDPAIDAIRIPSGGSDMYHAQFPQVEVTIADGQDNLPYSFVPTLYCFLSDGTKAATEEPNVHNFHFYIRTRCAYRGVLNLDGTSYDVWLGDSDGNGSFSDRFSVMQLGRSDDRIYGSGDTLYVVKNGERITYDSGLILGEYLALQDKVFEVSVRIPEGKMDLTPVTENLAMLETPAKLDTMQLLSMNGSKAVMVFDPAMKTRVPANQYRLASYRLQTVGEQGDRWTLKAIGTTTGPAISADVRDTTMVALGEPFSPVVRISEQSREQLRGGASSVSLSFEVHGAGDEIVAGLQRVSGENSKIAMSSKSHGLPAEPSYKIISDDGEVVTSGKFDYG